MKHFKISMIAVVAIVMGIAASAFTLPKAPRSEGWFTINPNSDPNLASSYTYSAETPACSASDVLCAIEGTQDPVHPTQPLQSDVNSAKTASSNFTMPVPGQVKFKDQ